MEERETNTHVIRRLSSLFHTQAEILLASPFATRINIESVVLNKHEAMEMDSKRERDGRTARPRCRWTRDRGRRREQRRWTRKTLHGDTAWRDASTTAVQGAAATTAATKPTAAAATTARSPTAPRLSPILYLPSDLWTQRRGVPQERAARGLRTAATWISPTASVGWRRKGARGTAAAQQRGRRSSSP
ncbi:unnamed protein product [Pylaiella littoralis]